MEETIRLVNLLCYAQVVSGSHPYDLSPGRKDCLVLSQAGLARRRAPSLRPPDCRIGWLLFLATHFSSIFYMGASFFPILFLTDSNWIETGNEVVVVRLFSLSFSLFCWFSVGNRILLRNVLLSSSISSVTKQSSSTGPSRRLRFFSFFFVVCLLFGRWSIGSWVDVPIMAAGCSCTSSLVEWPSADHRHVPNVSFRVGRFSYLLHVGHLAVDRSTV